MVDAIVILVPFLVMERNIVSEKFANRLRLTQPANRVSACTHRVRYVPRAVSSRHMRPEILLSRSISVHRYYKYSVRLLLLLCLYVTLEHETKVSQIPTMCNSKPIYNPSASDMDHNIHEQIFRHALMHLSFRYKLYFETSTIPCGNIDLCKLYFHLPYRYICRCQASNNDYTNKSSMVRMYPHDTTMLPKAEPNGNVREANHFHRKTDTILIRLFHGTRVD